MNLERFHRAIALRDVGKIEDAARELHRMAEESLVTSDRGLILLNEAICVSKLDRPLNEARELLKRASNLLGESEEMRTLIDHADASFYMGRNSKKALRKFDLVLKKHGEILLDPQMRELVYGEIQLRRALLLVELKQYEKARPVIEEVLDLDVEKDGQFYFSLGICYLALRENELARKHFEEALRLGLPEQKLVDCHFYLGVAYFRVGAYARALPELKSCESNIGKSKLTARTLYKWLSATCLGLSLFEDSKRYKNLSAKL